MSLKFWTVLTNHKQAVYVEDGKITKAIPQHPPKTIFRRVAVVTEYKGMLAMVRQASFELWKRGNLECVVTFPHKLIYTPHDITRIGDNFLICSSGLEMFFLMDIEGNVMWEWWGHENGIGAKNRFFSLPRWDVHQQTSDLCAPPIEVAAHFNSIYKTGKDTFITSALRKRKIIEITIGKPGFKLVADVDAKGCHSPFFDDSETLIYGTEEGIQIGDQRVLREFGWVKYVRPFEDGFAFAHQKGMAVVDGNWHLKEDIALPAPYKFAFMKRKK